jgi:hypothetical protein
LGWRDTAGRADPHLTSRDLRHTGASWHYAIHKDLLKLKLDGQWSGVTQIERVAHLMLAGCEKEIQAFWCRLAVDSSSITITVERPSNLFVGQPSMGSLSVAKSITSESPWFDRLCPSSKLRPAGLSRGEIRDVWQHRTVGGDRIGFTNRRRAQAIRPTVLPLSTLRLDKGSPSPCRS